MSGRYRISEDLNGVFSLYDNELLLTTFTRETFREALGALGRSSNRIGSMLRLFIEQFPLPSPVRQRTDLERAIDKLKPEGVAEYLRSKGFRVTKKLNGVSDEKYKLS